MATQPAFANAVTIGSGLLPATADTSLTAPTNVTTLVSAGGSGTKIDEIDFVGVGTTVAGLINIFLYDGTTYHLFDQVVVTAVTPSTTVASFRAVRIYANLEIPTGWSLRMTGTVAGNQSLVKATAIGGNY